jgi:hypothetical protein
MNVFLCSDHVKIIYEYSIQVFLVGELWYYSVIYICMYIKMMVLINDSDELYNCPGSFVGEYHYTEVYITLFQHITRFSTH